MRTVFLRRKLHLRNKRKRSASGPSRSSRTNPVRVSGTPRMRTTSEPASHRCVLGFYQGEMKARVDIYQGYADPPCVSALLCRCSRAEHLTGARWWMKESNPRVSPGSHQNCHCGWSEYSRPPRRSRSSRAPFAPQRHLSAAGYRRNPSRSRDTTIRGRRAWLHYADRDSYAIGLASGAFSNQFLGESDEKSAHDEYTSGRLTLL
jgi:hypothetical protein